MKSNRSARQSQSVYPPPQLSFPQFIAPFGSSDGARAAYRMFVGERTERHLSTDAFALDALERAWEFITRRPWPIDQESEARTSFVDLDPQVEAITRGGKNTHLLLAMLVSGMVVHQSIPEENRGAFTSEVGSIWALGAMDDTGRLTFEEDGLLACLARFDEYCHIDATARRNLFFLPLSAKPNIEDTLEALGEELDLAVHTFEREDLLMRLFFAQLEESAHIIFVPEASVIQLLDVFEQIWRDAHHASEQRHSSELAAGTILGERYEIARKLGAGGFAIVYEARDTKVERRVAIKVIDLERTSDEAHRPAYIRRFQREARLAAQVKHPCVVDIYDVGIIESSETPYMVMELLEGWDLEQYMRQHGPMPPDRLFPLFIQALEGLGCAHEAGIVHKDLKPSNLFLKYPGRRHEQISILDFGVARQMNTDTSRLTRTDSAFGTPHYMAPEYSTNQTTTPALDVYQMGLILVEMLMGAPVVTHPEPVAAMFQHVRGDLWIPVKLLESPLEPVLHRALAVDHEERYEDGFLFADALRAIDPSEIPLVSPSDDRVSLNPGEDSGVHEQRTPVMGHRRLSTDEYQVAHAQTMDADSLESDGIEDREGLREAVSSLFNARTTPAPRSIPRSQMVPPDRAKPPALEDAFRAPEETTRKELPSAKLDEADEDASSDSSTREDGEEKEVDDVLIVERSPLPYIVITAVVVAIAAGVVGWIVLSEPSNKNTTPVDVVTEYDRDLAALRERAEKLPELLEDGELDKLLEEVEAMDASSARLTPAEVEEVRRIVQRARDERANEVLLARAMEASRSGEHLIALDLLSTIPPDSVFRRHVERDKVLSNATLALVLRSEQLRNQGEFEAAEGIMIRLLAQDPQNSSIQNQLMLIQQDIELMKKMAQSAAEEEMARDMGAEMGAGFGPDMGMANDMGELPPKTLPDR